MISRIGVFRLALLAAGTVLGIPFQPERGVAATSLVQRPNDRQHGGDDRHWVSTWATSPKRQGKEFNPPNPPIPPPLFRNQTIRQIVHTSIGGGEVRVRFSNDYGNDPLVIGAAHIALRSSGASIVPETDRALTFGGEPSIIIPPHESQLSDAADLEVPPLSDLAVSLYLPDSTPGWTAQPLARQTNYVSLPDGNYADATDMPIASTETRWFFLTAVHVTASAHAATIVALGNSFTTGNGTTLDANRRYPDVLAARLQAEPDLQQLAVVNGGISGNRLIYDRLGPNARSRFDRDVLAQPGVRYVVVSVGANDIFLPGSGAPPSEAVTVEELIAGYRQLIARAHAYGLLIFGTTGFPIESRSTDEKEATREACNAWIRHSGEFDAVIDWDEVLRDPSHPTRILPAYLIGTSEPDHPNDAGTRAMAEAIPLRLFRD